MTPADDFAPLDEPLRRQAADWLALLHGPEAEAVRPAFDAWRAADPIHQRAFDQLAARYEQTAFIGSRPVGRDRHLRRASFRARHPVASASVAGGLVALLGLGIATLVEERRTGPNPTQLATVSPATLESSGKALRRLALDDGSRLLLDHDSMVAITYSSEQRALDLKRGRVRVEVAQDATRPFVVTAGGALIIARGTSFDVALRARGASVRPVEGIVEIRLAGPTPGDARLLRPGQQLDIVSGDARAPRTIRVLPARPDDWADMISFDGTRLPDAVAQINRGTNRPILLGSGLDRLRVTGAFRAGDSADFAEATRAMFNLSLAARDDGFALSRPADREKIGG